MPTFHDTKEDLVDALWRKMEALGVDKELIAIVADQTLHLIPVPDDVDSYDKLIDAVIQFAWKRGVRDALHAVEIGAIKGVNPSQGNN